MHRSWQSAALAPWSVPWRMPAPLALVTSYGWSAATHSPVLLNIAETL